MCSGFSYADAYEESWKGRNTLKHKWILPATAAVALIAIVGMIWTLMSTKNKNVDFTPPDFDPAAESGFPETTDESFTEVFKDGMEYYAHVCGRVKVKDGAADIYFTNDTRNSVWMKLRITDEKGKIVAETGLIRPGEYVKSVQFTEQLTKGEKIKLKIMAYEPDTYYSAGAVTLNTVIGE